MSCPQRKMNPPTLKGRAVKQELTEADLQRIPAGRRVLVVAEEHSAAELGRSDLEIKRTGVAENGDPAGSTKLQAHAHLVIQFDSAGRRWLLKDTYGDYVKISG